MGGSDHPNHTVLARRLRDYLRWRNANAATPTFWPPSAANGRASAANASNAGDGPRPTPHDQPCNRFTHSAQPDWPAAAQVASSVLTPAEPHPRWFSGGLRRAKRA